MPVDHLGHDLTNCQIFKVALLETDRYRGVPKLAVLPISRPAQAILFRQTETRPGGAVVAVVS